MLFCLLVYSIYFLYFGFLFILFCLCLLLSFFLILIFFSSFFTLFFLFVPFSLCSFHLFLYYFFLFFWWQIVLVMIFNCVTLYPSHERTQWEENLIKCAKNHLIKMLSPLKTCPVCNVGQSYLFSDNTFESHNTFKFFHFLFSN